MESLRIAIALIRVPRLFLTILLFPLLMGFALAAGQLVITGLFLKTLNRTAAEIEGSQVLHQRKQFVAEYLRSEKFETAKICEWHGSHPPEDPACVIRPLDVAIQSASRNEQTEELIRLFSAVTPRIHLCATCNADLTLRISGNGVETVITDVWGVLVLSAAQNEGSALLDRVLATIKERDRLRSVLGNVTIRLPGFRKPVNGTEFESTMALVFAASSILVIALWLALRAHRNVLDYFSKNGALTALVAATGKGEFYGALWCITAFRVFAFLIAVVPATCQLAYDLLSPQGRHAFMGNGISDLLLWLISIVSGLSVVMLIASVGELRQRDSPFSFLYKYLPVIAWALGSVVWVMTVLIPTPRMLMVRAVIASIPVVGLTPVMIAPALSPALSVLVWHALASSLLLALVLRANARWFAAHLEEL